MKSTKSGNTIHSVLWFIKQKKLLKIWIRLTCNFRWSHYCTEWFIIIDIYETQKFLYLVVCLCIRGRAAAVWIPFTTVYPPPRPLRPFTPPTHSQQGFRTSWTRTESPVTERSTQVRLIRSYIHSNYRSIYVRNISSTLYPGIYFIYTHIYLLTCF